MGEWRRISDFDPVQHRSSYLFTDGTNVVMGHWYEEETEPRVSYTGEEFPIFPTHWMPLPSPPKGDEGR